MVNLTLAEHSAFFGIGYETEDFEQMKQAAVTFHEIRVAVDKERVRCKNLTVAQFKRANSILENNIRNSLAQTSADISAQERDREHPKAKYPGYRNLFLPIFESAPTDRNLHGFISACITIQSKTVEKLNKQNLANVFPDVYKQASHGIKYRKETLEHIVDFIKTICKEVNNSFSKQLEQMVEGPRSPSVSNLNAVSLPQPMSIESAHVAGLGGYRDQAVDRLENAIRLATNTIPNFRDRQLWSHQSYFLTNFFKQVIAVPPLANSARTQNYKQTIVVSSMSHLHQLLSVLLIIGVKMTYMRREEEMGPAPLTKTVHLHLNEPGSDFMLEIRLARIIADVIREALEIGIDPRYILGDNLFLGFEQSRSRCSETGEQRQSTRALQILQYGDSGDGLFVVPLGFDFGIQLLSSNLYP